MDSGGRYEEVPSLLNFQCDLTQGVFQPEPRNLCNDRQTLAGFLCIEVGIVHSIVFGIEALHCVDSCKYIDVLTHNKSLLKF